jgi:type IV secretory pathway VirB10-like protein
MNREAKPEKPAEVQAMNAPSGIDLRPKPTRAVQVSKRAGIALCCLALGVLGLFAYGGYKRQLREQTAARGEAKQVAPATAAGTEILKEIQSAHVPGGRASTPKLDPPPDNTESTKTKAPLTRSANAAATPGPVQPVTSFQRVETTPEEKRLLWAYQQEQAAMAAPTAINGIGSSVRGSSMDSPLAARSSDDASRMAELAQALGIQPGVSPNAVANLRVPASGDAGGTGDYVAQNGQAAKEAFLEKARSGAKDDYLRSTRTAPLSKYEIKAGWEIPAVMEQGLNSDLPGELKALVAENVFDTATGKYLLIPQGARLVGLYDSHISYGQNGVQAVWNRVIFPDASTIDLNGMTGQDAQGYSGFRQTVDHHYKRLIGFAALTSLFSAGFAISQNQNQSALTYPSASQVAASAVGSQVTQLGAEITRRNLNVQPTIKVSAGYKFNVRVNRDIVFDAPYRPTEPAQ